MKTSNIIDPNTIFSLTLSNFENLLTQVDSVENNKSSSDDEGSAASTNKSLRMSAIVEENEMLRSQLKEMRATLEDCRLKLSVSFVLLFSSYIYALNYF